MAKKKKVKRKVKRAKRKVKKTKRKKVNRRKKAKRLTLCEKIAQIRLRVPYVEPTGECTDLDNGEVLFRFTEAQYVFELYRTECESLGLIFRPYFAVGIQPMIVPVGRGIALVAPFCIEDIETGEIVVGWGTGMGMNADWSGNTAGTRALKQFLLTTFQATWQDPEQIEQKEQKEHLRAEVLQELETDGTLAKIEMLKFFSQDIKKKGKPDEDSRGKNPTRGKRRHSKKN